MPSIAWRCLSSNVGPVETRMHQLLSRTFKRERLVHKSLEHELQAGVHALSVIARAVDEPLDTHTSPPCQKPVV
ncbi:hypothetical protein KSF78_0001519 [Schistosoma japonicum]|nr:hypothetical protein KSF78_0001519 [Schistosoma japonicum]